MDAVSILTALISVITVIGANYGLMKFLVRDFHKEQAKFNEEMAERKQEMKQMNNRMDGLYRILLDKTYPKE